MNKIENLKPFPKFCCSIGYIPTSYKVSMTYEDQLFWLCDFLENTVIPTVNQNGQAVEELQNLYVELKNYVDNYFTDLDIQEEINNKLDEMAESGELTDIIAQYLQLAGVLAYDTKTSMKQAQNLVDGSIAKTLGNTNYRDGKGSFYKVRQIQNTDVVDDNNIIALYDPDLVAEKIIDYNANDPTNPCYYGADPTGTYDSSVAIQQCLDTNIEKQISFTCGTYLVNTPIEISYNNRYGGINFNNSTLINNTENDYCIGVGTKNHDLTHANSNNTGNRFYNISNLKMRSVSDYAILIDRWFMNVRIDNIDIYTTKNGIQIGKRYENYGNPPSDVQLSNFILTNDDMSKDYTGINVIGTDNKFSDGRIYGFKTGINGNNNLLIMDNIHFLACNFGENILDNNYVCIKQPDTLFADLCYCDSYPCFVKATNNQGSILVTNLFIYSWHNQLENPAFFDFSDITDSHSVIDLNFKNIKFAKSNYPNSTKIIKEPALLNVKRSLLLGFNSYGNIRINGIRELTNGNKDLTLSKNGIYTNNYIGEWKENWIAMGYLNVISDGVAFINIIDDSLGLITFKVRFNSDLTIRSCEKVTPTTSYAPAIAFKLLESGLYEVFFAKNKNNLSTTTNVVNGIELIKNSCCYIVPIAQDLYNLSAPTATSVDIIST